MNTSIITLIVFTMPLSLFAVDNSTMWLLSSIGFRTAAACSYVGVMGGLAWKACQDHRSINDASKHYPVRARYYPENFDSPRIEPDLKKPARLLERKNAAKIVEMIDGRTYTARRNCSITAAFWLTGMGAASLYIFKNRNH